MSILCQKLVISENKPSAFAVGAAGAKVPLFQNVLCQKIVWQKQKKPNDC